MLLVMHTRFPGQGEHHEVRTHPMALTTDDWPVVLPHRFGGEAAVPLTDEQVVGNDDLLEHGQVITSELATPRRITLHADRTVSGEATGRWERGDASGEPGYPRAILELDGVAHEVVLAVQWHSGTQRWTTTFSGLSGHGASVWGSRLTEPWPPGAADGATRS